MQISDEQFQELINEAMGTLPATHVDNIKNVAILFEDKPTLEQRMQLELRHDQTLLGLYEGTPLSQRQGMHTQLPDRITLFKLPICERADNLGTIREEIRHTLWHEIAHYYGLNHDQIRELE